MHKHTIYRTTETAHFCSYKLDNSRQSSPTSYTDNLIRIYLEVTTTIQLVIKAVNHTYTCVFFKIFIVFATFGFCYLQRPLNETIRGTIEEK